MIELLKEHIPNGSNKLTRGVIKLKEHVLNGLTELYGGKKAGGLFAGIEESFP